jgi:pimeloyl-ACP methyl ester carboxylesterase
VINRLWCRDEREGAGPTLILLHGAGGSAHSFNAIWHKLKGINRLAVTLPGRLQSSGEAPTTVSDAADWLLEQLSKLDIDEMVVAGHSYGGALAIELGLRNLAALRGLVLMGTGGRIRVHPMIMAMVEQAAQTGITPPTPPGLWHPTTSPQLIQASERAAQQITASSALADWRAAHAFDRMGDLEAIHVPTLVIGGAQDQLTPPKYAQYLADHIPQSRRVELEDAGHLFPIERAGDVAESIRSFLASL